MQKNRSEHLALLTSLTFKKTTGSGKKNIQKYLKTSIFLLHMDASNLQLGAVISQKGKPIAFLSKKLNPAQTHYTTIEKELLAIVETLKEFKNILLDKNTKLIQITRFSPTKTTIPLGLYVGDFFFKNLNQNYIIYLAIKTL